MHQGAQTLAQIAAILNMTTGGVRRIEQSALQKLQAETLQAPS